MNKSQARRVQVKDSRNAYGFKTQPNRVKDPMKMLARVQYTLKHTQPELSVIERDKLAADIVAARRGRRLKCKGPYIKQEKKN